MSRNFTRRQYLQQLAALATQSSDAQSVLPAGIRSRFVDNINGLRMHILEAGLETQNRPCVLLLHGFPELAYNWVKVMPALAAAGYHVIAPDQRGHGRTTGWDGSYDGDLSSFSMLNIVRDALALISALGYRSVAVVGRDAGSAVAGWCALIRPDIFRSVVMMTAPFTGPPAPPSTRPPAANIDEQLAKLPRPRKYYQRYYTTREADGNMRNCPQGLHAFFRAYYYVKSADWKENQPFPLRARTAEEMAKMPTYYVMDLDKGMCETALEHMPSKSEIAACKWLTDADVDVLAAEYGRTGFQGALNWYRRNAEPKLNAELQLFAGKTIDVPSCFIAGKHDWGVYQTPGALDTMRREVCRKFSGVHLVEGAGHWVQQERPDEVIRLLLEFLRQPV